MHAPEQRWYEKMQTFALKARSRFESFTVKLRSAWADYAMSRTLLEKIALWVLAVDCVVAFAFSIIR